MFISDFIENQQIVVRHKGEKLKSERTKQLGNNLKKPNENADALLGYFI